MSHFGNLNPYEIHKQLINQYILKRPGDTKLLERDTSKDRTDSDVIRDNHKFLWDDDTVDTWEKQLAKKYYDKLFKEYCLADLSRYKDNKVALRWRVEKEVVIGKGQFICGNKVCTEKLELRSWEVNFAYVEHGQKKNALIKLRLCSHCSKKLNYHSKKREIKKFKKLRRKSKHFSESNSSDREDDNNTVATSSIAPSETSDCESTENSIKSTEVNPHSEKQTELEQGCWTKPINIEEKSRGEEFDSYLEDLLL